MGNAGQMTMSGGAPRPTLGAQTAPKASFLYRAMPVICLVAGATALVAAGVGFAQGGLVIPAAIGLFNGVVGLANGARVMYKRGLENGRQGPAGPGD